MVQKPDLWSLIQDLKKSDKALQKRSFTLIKRICEKEPDVLAPYFDEFIGLLKSDYHRMRWGSMQILNLITEFALEKTYKNLSVLEETAQTGGIVEKDQWVSILIQLGKKKDYYPHTFPLLLEQIWHAPTNQYPTYMEKATQIVQKEDHEILMHILKSRWDEETTGAKKARIERVLKKLSSLG